MDAETLAATHTHPSDDADHSLAVSGLHYTHFLQNFHEKMRPTTYLEVGTFSGSTVSLASCDTISVDPQFKIDQNVIGQKKSCFFFQEPSDQFFRDRSPTALFQRKVDLCFLDGMHLFEFLLRDFINAEKHCRSNSVIVMHDCLPPGFYMTCRTMDPATRVNSKFPDWWSGDVWKIVPVLQKLRPDLSITITDCAPTGLVLVTNLNPESRALESSYKDIIEKYALPADERSAYDSYWRDISITPSAALISFEQLSPRFWL